MSSAGRMNTPLKRALEAEGRRQTWLAERLGVDPRQVWGWVHGVHTPEPATREQIAQILGLSVEALWPAHCDEATAQVASDGPRRNVCEIPPPAHHREDEAA